MLDLRHFPIIDFEGVKVQEKYSNQSKTVRVHNTDSGVVIVHNTAYKFITFMTDMKESKF